MVLFVVSIFQEFNSEFPRRPNLPNFGSYMDNLYLSFRDGFRGRGGGGGGVRDDLRVLNTTGTLQNMQICNAFSAVHIMLYVTHSQKFTLCYCLVKSLLLRIRF